MIKRTTVNRVLSNTRMLLAFWLIVVQCSGQTEL